MTALIPQIPWAQNTLVVYRNGHIRLRRDDLDAEIGNDSSVWISRDSRLGIGDYLVKDESLTRDIREWFEECNEGDLECAKDWIEGATPGLPEGVLEWRPSRPPRPVWTFGDYRQGSTQEMEEWIGDPFDYSHFETPSHQEGLIISWRGERAPEVWFGDVTAFMDAQAKPDLENPETLDYFNAVFENGLVWAWDSLGLFDDPIEAGKLSREALQMLENNPELLWEDVIQKLLPVLRYVPPELEAAVNEWIMRRRREAERATGQKFLWRKLYPRMKQ